MLPPNNMMLEDGNTPKQLPFMQQEQQTFGSNVIGLPQSGNVLEENLPAQTTPASFNSQLNGGDQQQSTAQQQQQTSPASASGIDPWYQRPSEALFQRMQQQMQQQDSVAHPGYSAPQNPHQQQMLAMQQQQQQQHRNKMSPYVNSMQDFPG